MAPLSAFVPKGNPENDLTQPGNVFLVLIDGIDV